MKKGLSLLLLAMLFLSIVSAPSYAGSTNTRSNNYPIVFVHGMMGNDAILGVPYWGGMYRFDKDLNKRGYTAYVAEVGPFSSNWDRACELYAQIKGGTVDYGKAHSEKEGHARYGKTYPGFYPQWGEVNAAPGKVNKIHLISHSMGGQTVRVLAQLLENGSVEEKAATSPEELSGLFAGGKSWISGIITISACHNGSSMYYTVPADLIKWAVTELGAVVGQAQLEKLYDFGLDQWGLQRQRGESMDAYMERVKISGAWKQQHDLCTWELNPQGAMELNTWVKAQPDIYYFSQATTATHAGPCGYQVPSSKMQIPFWTNALAMGSYTKKSPVLIDKSWWENDGACNTISQIRPFLGSSDGLVNFDGTPQIGKWNYLGPLPGTDHFAVVGQFGFDKRPLYRYYAQLLGSLPN